MARYVHGYGTAEQERLVEQAEHWRNRLIRAGTELEPGTRLLEIGCGVGAVLAVLGEEFPGLTLTGVDIAPKQLEYARSHLERSGIEAALIEARLASPPTIARTVQPSRRSSRRGSRSPSIRPPGCPGSPAA